MSARKDGYLLSKLWWVEVSVTVDITVENALVLIGFWPRGKSKENNEENSTDGLREGKGSRD